MIFAVSIALTKSGKLEIGVVYDPIHKDLYSAEVGEGAFLNGERLAVSDTKDLNMTKVGYARPSRIKQEFIDIFSKLEIATRTPKMLGSMAMHLSYVSSGRLDAAICLYPNPWDVAAAKLLVEEAGGKVTDLDGNEWSFSSKNILASNGRLHEQLLAKLR